MADVTIDSSVYTYAYYPNNRGGPFWKNTTTCYIVHVDSGGDLVYDKSSDGGANWAGAHSLVAGQISSYNCWADWETPSDSGTKIHIVCIDQNSDDILYVWIDTADDSHGTDTIEDCQGTGAINATVSRAAAHTSITKTRGGNIAVTFHYRDSGATDYYGFYTSPDGDTWSSKADPWEASTDYLILFPGNYADNNDIDGVYWDSSATEISLKTFDNSGNSWSEQAISAVTMTINNTHLQYDGAIRHSDGHLILAAWSQYDNAAADLMTWDINGAGSITAKTNIITDEAENFLVSVFINQSNNYIYVAYVQGSSAGSTVSTVYQYSDDGMATWEGETAMQADAEDDERWVSCGAVKTSGGGKFMPIWMNDDLNDIFCNTDNAVAIAASGGGGWTNIAKINGVTATDLAKVDGISVDDIAKICGVAV